MASSMLSDEDVLREIASLTDDDDSTNDPNYAQSSQESESESSDDDPTEAEPQKSSRKRKRNRKNSDINKQKKDKGQSHTTRAGKTIEAKHVGPECKCALNCFEEVGNENVKQIFDGFWSLASRDKQNSYLFGCCEVTRVKRRHAAQKEHTKRNCSVVYTVQSSDGRVKVCKQAFLSMHGLQQNRGRVDRVVKTIREGHFSPVMDRRGKHNNRPNAYSHDKVEQVRQHIKSIPKYTSHYSRKSNPNKTYMSLEYTIEACFQNYKNEYCVNNGFQPVSSDKYRRIFVEDFNIGFKTPKSDTCKTCDEFNINIVQAKTEQDEAKVATLEKEKELHHRKAEAGQENIKIQAEQAKASDGNGYHVITFDLQQTLPTPKLSTGPSFYKRKIWTYNLNIHDCKSDKGFCYVWDETVAGRGSEEIGSCLKKHIEDNNIRGGTLVAISDNCAGQNKNWNIQFLWMYFLARGRFDKVEQHFLLSGHSMLPSDRDFAHIENYVRHRLQYVFTPEHWRQVIVKSSEKLRVTEMTMNDFVKLSALKVFFTVRTKTVDGNPVNFKNGVRFRIRSDEEFGLIEISSSFNTDVWNIVSVNKRGRPKSAIATTRLPLKYSGPRATEQVKVEDVMSLLAYIPPVHHGFYSSLKSAGQAESDTDGGCIE